VSATSPLPDVAAPPVLTVRGLGKKLTRDLVLARRHGTDDILRDLFFAGPNPNLRTGEFWALRDIDLEVAPGEALGVIGHNGAGKTTLLRLLHGLTRPDAGTVDIRGRHAALLDLGVPFNRLLTGRENITTAAAIHGIARAEADGLVEAVADFSELGAVLDAPMWTYSSGMQMRLGFGIAAQVNAKLLLVDEVIAVGDLSFQRKCLSHIRRHLSDGGSVVLVSHDLWMIQTLCQRCVVLGEGRIVTEGTPNRAISTYLRQARTGIVFIPRARAGFAAPEAAGEAAATIEVVRCEGPEGRPPRNGDDITVEMDVRGSVATRTVRWYLDLLSADRQLCIARLRPPAGADLVVATPEGATVTCTIPDAPLFPGTFYLSAHLVDPDDGEEIGSAEEPFAVEVESNESRVETLAMFAGALSSVESSYSLD
jgi:lipopolysaccharide transport system ATP-binding protein